MIIVRARHRLLWALLLGVAGSLLWAPRALDAQRSVPAGGRARPAVDTAALSSATGARIRAGSVVTPDTVEVGDPFTLVVTVVVPADARVEWPSIQDTAAVVAMRAPVRIVDEGTKLGSRRERAEYQLSAWDVGQLPIGMPDVLVRQGASTVRVPLTDMRIMVRSVLPGDSTLHVPKPARDLFPRVVPWWQRWWPALLVVAALALLWWLWRRRRTPAAVRSAAPPLDPYARAVHEFDRLDTLALPDAGEAGRYVALSVDVLHMYLALRIPEARASLTSGELLLAVASDARVPHDRLLSLLADADGVKFAAHEVSPARARVLATEARSVVEHVEQADRLQRAAAEAARQAAQEAAERDQRELEDRARRASRKPRSGASGPKAGAR